jgi:conjugal transfer pilus assembly protein TraF
MLSKTRSFKTLYHLTWTLTFLIFLVRLSHADLLDSTTLPNPEEKQSSMILKEEEPASEVPVDFRKPYYHDREEGWFWYIDPQPPKKKEKKKSQPAPQPARIEPKDYKTGWPDFKNADDLHAYQKQILDNAVMDPTPEKVKKYLDFQKYIMSKSRLFTDVAQRVIWESPELDTAAQKPRADYARSVVAQITLQEMNQKLIQMGKQGGIFFIFSSTCPYCKLEAPILKRFENTYGIKVIPVTIDGGGLPEYPNPILDNGIASALNVNVTPTLFFGVPPKDMRRIANGFIAFDELQERLINISETGGNEK